MFDCKPEPVWLNKIVNVTKIKDARLERWVKSEAKFGLAIPMLDKIATNDEPIRRQ